MARKGRVEEVAWYQYGPLESCPPLMAYGVIRMEYLSI